MDHYTPHDLVVAYVQSVKDTEAPFALNAEERPLWIAQIAVESVLWSRLWQPLLQLQRLFQLFPGRDVMVATEGKSTAGDALASAGSAATSAGG